MLTRWIIRILEWLLNRLRQSHYTVEGMFMYIVKDDNPDVGYHLAFTVTDAEGNPVDPGTLNVVVTTTDPAVVAATPTDPMNGTVHFGNPGLSTFQVTVEKSDGTVLGSFAADFTVTTGDPAAISGGTVTFDGLTES